MTFFSGLVTFLCIWWTSIFMVLPWGNDPEPGRELAANEFFGKSAPANPRIKQKFMITTVLSIVIWLAVFALVESDVISFRDIAASLARQDGLES